MDNLLCNYIREDNGFMCYNNNGSNYLPNQTKYIVSFSSKACLRREVVDAVKAMVKADRKIGCLKQLQGHMWRKGYKEGSLKGQ